MSTRDGGYSWSTWTPPHKLSGGVSDSVLTGHQRHDLGEVAAAKNKDQPYCSFNSTLSTVFTFTNASFVAGTVQKPIVFRGIPQPCFSCGNVQHKFGCPFRTGGRGYVRLDDGSLVCPPSPLFFPAL